MAPFKDDQPILIAPGSQTTLAQQGLPESFTPARVRVRSCMFPGEEAGQWEPYKYRKVERKAEPKPEGSTENPTSNGEAKEKPEEEPEYEEDQQSEEGAVWPIQGGKVVNWPCFYALLNHIWNILNPPFHTPVLLVSEPTWTIKDHERLAQFFFEKFKIPAYSVVDSGVAAAWAYGVQTATVVDVGLHKADVTAISDFIPCEIGRGIAIPDCGGEALTQTLLNRLKSKGFNKEMAEQLKKTLICEILPPKVPLPGQGDGEKDLVSPVATTSSMNLGASGSGVGDGAPARRPGTGPEHENDELANGEQEEGVLDVASIVTGGNMSEYLAKKEKEKQDRLAARKKGGDAPAAPAKPMRLPNSKKEKATFMYADYALMNAVRDQDLGAEKTAELKKTLDEGSGKATDSAMEVDGAEGGPVQKTEAATTAAKKQSIRREIEVGVERFQATSDGYMERLADAVYRTISSVPEVNKRSELWDSLVVCGNGSKIRGFRDALISTLNSKYLISPSSATIFTSEIPSNMTTPTGTGANTPQPHAQPSHASHVNPLLIAATTAQNPHLAPPSFAQHHTQSNYHSSHGQTPTSIKLAKIPEYFPEWKEFGYEEAHFLGAQVAAKVLFITDQGKSYMTRTDYNEMGPSGIHGFAL